MKKLAVIRENRKDRSKKDKKKRSETTLQEMSERQKTEGMRSSTFKWRYFY